MRELIFISGTPISRIVGEKLDVDYYTQNGFVVKYWDLSRLNYSEKALDSYFSGHEDYRFEFPRVRNFFNKNEVNNAFQGLSSDTVFCHVDFDDPNDYWLRRLFKNNNIQYYVGPRRTSEDFEWYYKKRILRQIVFLRKVVLAIRNPARLFSYIQRKFCNVIYRHTNYYQKPAFVIGSGSLGRSEWLRRTQAKRFASVPSKDLVWETLPDIVNEPYCTYVDDSIVYSPDQSMFKGKSSTSLDIAQYSNNICNAFEMIERGLGCPVVIAASGKYRYPDNEIFGGRKIMYAKTNQLIQHATLVIGHASSATWQVIVNSKPIILLWDPSFIKAKNLAVTLQGNYLGVTPIMSTELTVEHLNGKLEINQAHYSRLVEQYFCEQGVTGAAHELIAQELGQYY